MELFHHLADEEGWKISRKTCGAREARHAFPQNCIRAPLNLPRERTLLPLLHINSAVEKKTLINFRGGEIETRIVHTRQVSHVPKRSSIRVYVW